MKLIGNNGEILAEWDAVAGKRNLYCKGGFGLMLTKRALCRCVAADDVESGDLFQSSDNVPEQVEAAAVTEREEQKSVFRLFGLEL